MLSTLTEEQKADLKSFVAPLVQAYNATRSDATGYTPHYLMFGWHPRLPIDVFFGMDINKEKGDHPTYVTKLKDRMDLPILWHQRKLKELPTRIKRTMTRRSSLPNLRLEIGCL